MYKAKKMNEFGTSIFTELKIMKQEYTEKTGKDTIDFSIGSPNISPVDSIVEEMVTQIQRPANFKYAISELPEMLTTVQKWYHNRYGVDLDTDQIICTSGSQEALSTICLALCDPGDLVLVPDPCYPIFQDGPKIASCKVSYMPLKAENDFVLDLKDIDPEVAKQAKLLIISYPNNPTCAIAPDSFYEELIDFAKQYDLMVIHDNAYSELVFDGKVGKSFLSFDGAMDVGIELNSLSKTFGLAGARLGFVVGNKEMVSLYRKLKSNMDYGVFLPVQYAGIEALDHCQEAIQATRQAYEDRRNALVKYFGQAGWTIPASAGTMFAWAPIPDVYADSNAFVKDLLKKTGIVVTPGQSFGAQGMRYVRLALVEDINRIQEAGKRLAVSGIWRQ